jgi:hypothetical protein
MHGDKPYTEWNRTEHVPILEIHRHCITTNSNYILFSKQKVIEVPENFSYFPNLFECTRNNSFAEDSDKERNTKKFIHDTF